MEEAAESAASALEELSEMTAGEGALDTAVVSDLRAEVQRLAASQGGHL